MTTRTDPTPYVAIDLMTNEIVGRYSAQYLGYEDNKGKPVEVFYRPRKRLPKEK